MAEKVNKPKKIKVFTKKKPASAEPVKKRRLTEEEKTARDARRVKAIQQKRARREKALAVFAVMMAVYLGVIGIIAAYGILSFNSVAESDKVYSVEGYMGETKIFTVSAAQANNSYGLYVPFSTLTKLCPMSIAGDGDSVAIILPDTGDYIKCFSNSSSIWVNDAPCRLSSPVLFEESDYLIPVELLEYINGLKITYGDDRVCTLYRQDAETVLSASHSLPVGIDHIEFSPLYDTDYIYGDTGGGEDISDIIE